jgi:hypothetical protein
MFVSKHRLQNEADGGDGADGSAGGAEDAFTRDQVQSMIDEATSGLKNNNEKLLGQLKNMKDVVKKYDGFDIDTFNKMKEKIDNEEEQKLIDKGDIDQLFERRYERMKADHESQKSALQKELEEERSQRQKIQNEFVSERVNGQIRQASEKSGVLPEAIDDIIRRAGNVFDMENGEIVARDANGNLIMSKDGTSVLTPKEFVEELKQDAPHYWAASNGAGAGGAGAGKSSTDIESLMHAAVKSGNMKEYRRLREQLSKAS